jgi:hypothetical protein
MSHGMGNCCNKCGRDSVNDLCSNCVTPAVRIISPRTPDMMATMAYGAPGIADPVLPAPWYQPPPVEIAPPGREVGTVDWARFAGKRKLRISTISEETGELKLKVFVDGELVYEAVAEHGTTLTVETFV